MWDRIKFVIENLKAIILAGVIFWAPAVAGLQILHISLELECQSKCMQIIDWTIHSAYADQIGQISSRPSAPLPIRLALLPDRQC